MILIYISVQRVITVVTPFNILLDEVIFVINFSNNVIKHLEIRFCTNSACQTKLIYSRNGRKFTKVLTAVYSLKVYKYPHPQKKSL